MGSWRAGFVQKSGLMTSAETGQKGKDITAENAEKFRRDR
jgi:hypothetical protein